MLINTLIPPPPLYTPPVGFLYLDPEREPEDGEPGRVDAAAEPLHAQVAGAQHQAY